MRPFETCHEKFKGLCEENAVLEQAMFGTKNFYAQMQAAKLSKSGPLVVQFQVKPSVDGDAAAYYFFLRFYGRGEVAILVEATAHEDDIGPDEMPYLEPALVNGSCIATTSQLAFRRLLFRRTHHLLLWHPASRKRCWQRRSALLRPFQR